MASAPDPTARPVTPVRPGDRVVIIGAGPAGLTAAYELAKRSDVRITVLEGDQAVGGISRTVQYKGYRFDLGGHRFFTKIAPVQRMWREILGDEFIKVPRLSRIFYNGKYFDYPLRPMNALTGLGLWNAALIVLSYLKWHYRPYPVEENFEQWVTNRFGRRLYLAFFKTYTEKVWGLPCTRDSRRVGGAAHSGSVAGARDPQRDGPQQAIDRHQDADQRVRLSAARSRPDVGNVPRPHRPARAQRADGASRDPDRAHERQSVGGRGGGRWPRSVVPGGSCDLVDAAAHARAASASAAGPEATAAADGLTYRDFLVVALMLKREKLFPDNWIYIHTPGVKVGRIQNFNNWSAAMVPTPGITCLGMEYFCFEGDGLWSSADEELARLAASELEQLGLAREEDVIDARVVRVPKAYPIYDSVYREHIDRHARVSSIRFRTCTPSAATACTSTTTRITRC